MDWCELGFHEWKDGKMQTTGNKCYGAVPMPGLRLHQKCKKCLKERYLRLTLYMPASEMKKEEIWQDV